MISLSCASIIAQVSNEDLLDIQYNILVKKNKDNYDLNIDLINKHYISNRTIFDECNISVYDNLGNLINKSILVEDNEILSSQFNSLYFSNTYNLMIRCLLGDLDFQDEVDIDLKGVKTHLFTITKQFEIIRDIDYFSMDTFIENLFLTFIH